MSRMKDLFGDTPYVLPTPAPSEAFDGETYSPKRDYERLHGQMLKVFEVIKDGRWHTLAEIARKVEGAEAAVSARLRDFRKKKYGGHTVKREHMDGGVHRYRLVLDGTAVDEDDWPFDG